jgi:hypothetical protein
MKAAVITQSGVWLPQVLPFGLRNAPSGFQQTMATLLQGIPNTACYLDDIIIFNREDSQLAHLDSIKNVLRVLHKANLKINLAKCEFFRTRLKFLGKVVSAEGIQPLAKHVEAIRDFPVPTSTKDLQRFLGLANWLSCFLYNYSQRIDGLCQALTASKWEWTKENQKDFDALKGAITESTIRYHLNYSAPLYLSADACNESYAAILYQVQSFDRSDLPELERLVAEGKSFDHIPTNTKHPVLPKTGKGVPREFALFGKEPSSEPVMDFVDQHTTQTIPVSSTPSLVGMVSQPQNHSFPIDPLVTEKPKALVIDQQLRDPWHLRVLEKINARNNQKESKIGTTLTKRIIKQKWFPEYNLNQIAEESGKVHVVRVVGYHSGLFRNAQLNYTTLEKETTALVNSIEYWRDELFCHSGTHGDPDEQRPELYMVSDAQALL